ncbi:MAG: hypothetical protein K2Y04_04420 [Caulobacteraceae bacterium]|nr:hypothetical protein [Caulobacteraceae bacterium]
MTHLRRHWLPGLLGLCALLTLGLLAWPTGAARPAGPPAAERYTGPDIETRRGGPAVGFALRLEGPDAAPQTAPPPEALPVLVGIAGRRAYLRSTDGEVERVSIGQEIDGWRLVAVGGCAATLRGPDGDRRIEMFASGPDPAASGAAPVPGEASPPIQGG